jgi:anaerobic selenocysteine-containing dehydrogenase
MNAVDAARCGVVDGGRAVVASRVGEVIVVVEVSDAMMPGVVSLPHGWGHDVDGARQAVARSHAGVSLNVLTDDERLDAVSGTAAFNGLPVRVTPA